MKIKVPLRLIQNTAKKVQFLTLKIWMILTASPDISSMTSKSCLALNIDRGIVSFIYLTRRFNGYTVQAEKIYEFTEKAFPQPRDIQSYLRSFLEENRLPRVPITIVVPKSWVIIKKSELPVAVENFMSEAIANEMDTLTPFNVEEVLYDFSIIGRTESFKLTEQSYEKLKKDGLPEDILSLLRIMENQSYNDETDFVVAIEKAIGPEQTVKYKSDILKSVERTDTVLSFILGAIKEDRINPYIEHLADDGFKVTGVSIDIAALGTFLSHINKKRHSDFLFCSVADRDVEVAVYKERTLFFIHTESSGQDSKEQGHEVSELVSSACEFFYTQDDSKNREEVPLFLDCKNTSLKNDLLNNSELIFTPFEMVDIGSFKLTGQGRSIFSATGAALESLRANPKDMNLLLGGKRPKTKKSYFLTFLLIFLLAALFVSSQVIPYNKSKRILEELTESVEKLEASVIQSKKMKKKIKELQENIATIDDFSLHAFLPIEITKELTTLIPKDTWLTKLRIKSGSVELEGYSKSATSLIVKLEESKYFKKVEFSSPTIKDRRLNMDRFRIRAEINDSFDDKE